MSCHKPILVTGGLVVLVLIALPSLAGCRPLATNIERELRLNLGVEPATIDPAMATDPSSQQIARMLFLSLVDAEPATGAPQHSLAISWAVSADGLIWEFKLRNDAVWVRYVPAAETIETKRPVTADDVVYSVRRVFDPRVGSGFAPPLAPLIRGAQALRAADPKKTDEKVLQQLIAGLAVQALDDTTVRFTLTRPASHFPSIVSAWLGRLQPKEAVEEGASVWTEPGTVWTNGPYVLESWRHGREITLLRNKYWYDAQDVHIERIRFAMIADTATALEEYKSGRLDSLDPYSKLTPTDVDSLKQDPVLGKQLRLVPTLCTHYYGFNTSKPPFDDVTIRRAFAAALDRETLATSVVRLGEPSRWFTRPGVFASFDISDTLGIPFNANQARGYITQSGVEKRRLVGLTLAVNTDSMNELIAETAVQMWKNNLGVEVSVKSYDWKSYLQLLRDDPPPIFRLGWCAYYPDAANFVGSAFQSSSIENTGGAVRGNYTRWTNSRLDQMIDSAARETDTAKRAAIYRAAEKILIEDNVVVIPLWWSTRATLTRPNIQRTYAITDGYERLETWSIQ